MQARDLQAVDLAKLAMTSGGVSDRDFQALLQDYLGDSHQPWAFSSPQLVKGQLQAPVRIGNTVQVCGAYVDGPRLSQLVCRRVR
jgi:hypothetical protein